MPTDWTYHVETDSPVQTTNEIDGTLKSVTVDLDGFRVREWPEDEDEIEAEGKRLENLDYDHEKDVFVEHGDGAHAIFTFDVNDGAAELTGFGPADGNMMEPRHMSLLPAVERIVEQLDDVDICWKTLETLANVYHEAADSGVVIERLDT